LLPKRLASLTGSRDLAATEKYVFKQRGLSLCLTLQLSSSSGCGNETKGLKSRTSTRNVQAEELLVVEACAQE
jgi:hypothetical protein